MHALTLSCFMSISFQSIFQIYCNGQLILLVCSKYLQNLNGLKSALGAPLYFSTSWYAEAIRTRLSFCFNFVEKLLSQVILMYLLLCNVDLCINHATSYTLLAMLSRFSLCETCQHTLSWKPSLQFDSVNFCCQSQNSNIIFKLTWI